LRHTNPAFATTLLNGPQKAAESKKETTKKELSRGRKEYAKQDKGIPCTLRKH